MSTPDDVLGQLRQARLSAHAIAPLAPQALDRQQGYALLRQTLERRVAAGEKPSGWKVAFAGRAAQARFALDEPVYGGLTEAMQVEPGSAVPLVRLIQPKLEVELAFVFGHALAPGDYRDQDILTAIAEVAPAFEIADCRWQGWRFGLGAFLADNAAAGLYCVGPRSPFEPQQHACVPYRLEHEGVHLGSGDTQAREDNPCSICAGWCAGSWRTVTVSRLGRWCCRARCWHRSIYSREPIVCRCLARNWLWFSRRTLCPCECQLPSGMTEPPSGQ